MARATLARALRPVPPEVRPYLGPWLATRCGTAYSLRWSQDEEQLQLQRRDESPYEQKLEEFLRQLRFGSFHRPPQ